MIDIKDDEFLKETENYLVYITHLPPTAPAHKMVPMIVASIREYKLKKLGI